MKPNKKAVTLLEIIVALAIFALIVTGMINVFVAAQRHMTHSRSKMGAGEIAKHFLGPLQAQVNQSTWATNWVGTGATAADSWTDTSSNTRYDAAYDSDVYSGTAPQQVDLRKVTIDISWPAD